MFHTKPKQESLVTVSKPLPFFFLTPQRFAWSFNQQSGSPMNTLPLSGPVTRGQRYRNRMLSVDQVTSQSVAPLCYAVNNSCEMGRESN